MTAGANLLADMHHCLASGTEPLPRRRGTLGLVPLLVSFLRHQVLFANFVRFLNRALGMDAGAGIADFTADRTTLRLAAGNQGLRFFMGHAEFSPMESEWIRQRAKSVASAMRDIDACILSKLNRCGMPLPRQKGAKPIKQSDLTGRALPPRRSIAFAVRIAVATRVGKPSPAAHRDEKQTRFSETLASRVSENSFRSARGHRRKRRPPPQLRFFNLPLPGAKSRARFRPVDLSDPAQRCK